MTVPSWVRIRRGPSRCKFDSIGVDTGVMFTVSLGEQAIDAVTLVRIDRLLDINPVSVVLGLVRYIVLAFLLIFFHEYTVDTQRFYAPEAHPIPSYCSRSHR